jgi:hypothetical protein
MCHREIRFHIRIYILMFTWQVLSQYVGQETRASGLPVIGDLPRSDNELQRFDPKRSTKQSRQLALPFTQNLDPPLPVNA